MPISHEAPQGAFFISKGGREMPYRPSDRQYRNFNAGSFAPEVREASDNQEQSYMVRGYFCTFAEPYELFPGYFEEIDYNAFDECDMSDVLLQVNHDGFVYARNRNGSLRISTDDHGGHCVADLSGSKQGREDLYEAISNGLIDTMSFGFTIADDGFEWEQDDDGIIHTRITKISKLYDVSAIAGFAANPGTEISARSLRDGIIEAIERRSQEQPDEQAPEDRDATDTAETIVEALTLTDEPTVIDGGAIDAAEVSVGASTTDSTIDFEQAMEQRRSLRRRRARAMRLSTI